MRPGDTATFDTKRFEKSVEEMRSRGEEVHAKGREVFRRTGRLDRLVNVHGALRLSHNSMTKDGDKAVLKNGIALPVWSGFDGTGSMGHLAGVAHNAMGEINSMLDGIRDRYNPQLATSVLQDVDDMHDPFQMSQFEGDQRVAEQIRLLIPDHDGGDAIEDYQLGLAFLALATHTDIHNFYGLKGYGMVVGDQIGRERVTVEDVDHFLGHKLQGTMTTKAVARQLWSKWHLFYLHIVDGSTRRDEQTRWWDDKLEKGHTVVVPNENLLAESQAALIYVTETLDPTEDGLFEFLSAAGANKKITKADAKEIWGWIIEAGVPFGAQAKLPGYSDIPMPGAVFAHYRHQWPIDHPKAAENVIPVEPAVADISAGAPKSEKIGWDGGKF
jgi:hypothetical protein